VLLGGKLTERVWLPAPGTVRTNQLDEAEKYAVQNGFDFEEALRAILSGVSPLDLRRFMKLLDESELAEKSTQDRKC
jgi:hypothetical protein